MLLKTGDYSNYVGLTTNFGANLSRLSEILTD